MESPRARRWGPQASTADCWNRLRDKERVEGELGLRETGVGSWSQLLASKAREFRSKRRIKSSFYLIS